MGDHIDGQPVGLVPASYESVALGATVRRGVRSGRGRRDTHAGTRTGARVDIRADARTGTRADAHTGARADTPTDARVDPHADAHRDMVGRCTVTTISDTPPPAPRHAALSRTFRLDPELCSVAIARRHVSAVVSDWGAAIDVDTAILLTSELVANAVIHASAPGEPVWLAILCCGDHLRVEVHDPAGRDVECKRLTMDGESGRGLAIVAALADFWGWEPTDWGKNVYFSLSAATAAQAA